MRKAPSGKILRGTLLLCLGLFLALSLLLMTAQTAGAQTTKIDPINAPATISGGWVGMQIVIWGWPIGATPSPWDGAVAVNVTFAGQPVVITNSVDDPVTLITNLDGSIAPNTYFFRVPKGMRGLNQLVFSGPKTLGNGTVVTNQVVMSFRVATGIGVTKGTSPLPDWSKSSEKVGRNLIIYGTGFGISGTDTGITIYWDDAVVASGLSADSDGRWQTTIAIPETPGRSSGLSHVIKATSIKLQSQGMTLVNGTVSPPWMPMAYASDTYRVKPGFILNPTTAAVGDTVNITGQGWAGSAEASEIGITVSISAGATVKVASTIPANLKADAKGSFSGSFIVPDFALGTGGPVNVTVTDSAETGLETEPMTLQYIARLTASPNHGRAGDNIFVTGEGFTAGSLINSLILKAGGNYYNLKHVPESVIADTNGMFSALFVVPDLGAGAAGAGQIMAADSSLESRTATRTFTIDSNLPAPPLLISPANNTSIASARPTLTWSSLDYPTPPFTYDLQIDNDISMSSPEISKNSLSSGYYALSEAETLSTGTWYWRVRSRNSALPPVISEWSSPPWSFNIWGTATLAYTRIVYPSNKDFGTVTQSEIYVLNLWDNSQVRLTNNSFDDREPRWSPDGSKIAFSSNRDGNSEIYVMNADGSSPTRLTNNASSDSSPWWSPDGGKIAFQSLRDGNLEIYVMNADGSNPTRLTSNGWTDTSPSFSSVSGKIVFVSGRDGNSEIYVMDSDGANQARLTNNSASDVIPRYSPDGSRIVFRSDRDTPQFSPPYYEIYVMNADGTNQTRLTSNIYADSVPAWSSDGSRIVFASDRDGNLEMHVMTASGAYQTQLTFTDFNVSGQMIENGAPHWSGQYVPPKDSTPPSAPVLTSPANGSVINLATAVFIWGLVTDTSSPVFYEIQMATSASFGSPVISAGYLALSGYVPDVTLATGTHYWRVRARDNAIPSNVGPWSTPAWSFTVSSSDTTSPDVPTLVTPMKDTLAPAQPTLVWSVPFEVSPPLFYDLLVSSSAYMAAPVLSKTGLATSSYTLSGAEALASGIWYWSVRARDSAASSNSSAWAMPPSRFIVSAAWSPQFAIPSPPSAPPVSTFYIYFNIDTHTTTGTWVGQQLKLASDTAGRWNPNTALTVTFGGQPVAVTDANDVPVILMSDGSGKIPYTSAAAYFFRVPKAIRGLNQVIVSGQKTVSGATVTVSQAAVFRISTGIGVTRYTNPLPDWSKAAERVGNKLVVYGTGFGMSGTDGGIVVFWDGSVVASGLSADSDGRWETIITVPESTGKSSGGGQSHVIKATSIKLQSQGVMLGNGTVSAPWSPLSFVSDTFRVKPGFTVSPAAAKTGDTVNIFGYGFAGSALVSDVLVNIAVSTGAFLKTATTAPASLKTNANGSFSGSFIMPDLSLNAGGTATVTVTDSALSTATGPMTISASSITVTASWSPGWVMWSYPLIPDTATNAGQLGDDISPLHVFHYNAFTNSYDLTTVATPGWGYWTKVSSTTPIDVTGLSATDSFSYIALGSSWNQIGSPYTATVAWSNVSFFKDGVTKSLAEAVGAGWVSQWIYYYDTQNGVYVPKGAADGVLTPLVGYWMRAFQPGVTLRIPKP